MYVSALQWGIQAGAPWHACMGPGHGHGAGPAGARHMPRRGMHTAARRAESTSVRDLACIERYIEESRSAKLESISRDPPAIVSEQAPPAVLPAVNLGLALRYMTQVYRLR